jgi:acetyltransferase-like isoleucine patch superfamily enzyme
MDTEQKKTVTADGYGSMSPLRKLGILARRFLLPASIVSAFARYRWGVHIDRRAEVELAPNLQLGTGTSIAAFSKFKATRGPLVTGQTCSFDTGCFVSAGPGGLIIGDNLVCGANVVIIASNYRYERLDVTFDKQGRTSIGIRIGNNVHIGANSVIVDGASLGDNCTVAPNSLVTRKFPADSVVIGVPAAQTNKADKASTDQTGKKGPAANET